MLVIADGDSAKAAGAGRPSSAGEIWDMRDAHGDAARHRRRGDRRARWRRRGGPVVLADVADNAGGGAPVDNTFDPAPAGRPRRAAARSSAALGPAGGAVLHGGRRRRRPSTCASAANAARPPAIRSTCASRCARVLPEHIAGRAERRPRRFGPSAWVQAADGIDLVLITMRSQMFAPDAFTGLGITLADKRIVVVKSTQHFYAGFAPIARRSATSPRRARSRRASPPSRSPSARRRSGRAWPTRSNG